MRHRLRRAEARVRTESPDASRYSEISASEDRAALRGERMHPAGPRSKSDSAGLPGASGRPDHCACGTGHADRPSRGRRMPAGRSRSRAGVVVAYRVTIRMRNRRRLGRRPRGVEPEEDDASDENWSSRRHRARGRGLRGRARHARCARSPDDPPSHGAGWERCERLPGVQQLLLRCLSHDEGRRAGRLRAARDELQQDPRVRIRSRRDGDERPAGRACRSIRRRWSGSERC